MKDIKHVTFGFVTLRPGSTKTVLPAVSLIVLIAFLNLLNGCSYYKVKTADTSAFAGQLQNPKRYFIIHHGNVAWHLKDVSLNNEKQAISGVKDSLPGNHQYYITAQPNKLNRYEPKKGEPRYEVHLYIAEYAEGENSKITIPFSSISKIEVYDKAVGISMATHVFPFVAGGVVITMVIAMLIVVILYIYVIATMWK